MALVFWQTPVLPGGVQSPRDEEPPEVPDGEDAAEVAVPGPSPGILRGKQSEPRGWEKSSNDLDHDGLESSSPKSRSICTLRDSSALFSSFTPVFEVPSPHTPSLSKWDQLGLFCMTRDTYRKMPREWKRSQAVSW